MRVTRTEAHNIAINSEFGKFIDEHCFNNYKWQFCQ